MSVRGYLNRTGTVGVTEAPFDAYWSSGFSYPASSAVTKPHQTAAGTETLTSQSASTSATANIPWLRHVSNPLPAGPVEGTFRMVVLGSHQVANSARLAAVVTLWNGDLTVKRGQLGVFTSAGYFPTTQASQTIDGTLTPVTAQAGDRILIATGQEIVRTDGSTSRAGTLRIGNPTAATADLTFGNGATTDLRPWWEFSQAIYTTRPGGLAVDPGLTTAYLTWSQIAGASGYQVREGAAGAVTDLSEFAASHTFTGLAPSTGYTLYVRAVTATGPTAWASIATTTDDPTPPTGLVVDPDVSSLALSWDAVAGASGYQVRQGAGGAVVDEPTTAHTFTGLVSDTTYTLYVRAIVAGAPTAWASITATTDVPPPIDPDTVAHRADVTLGARSWTIDPTTPPDFDAELWLLDGAQVGWAMPEAPTAEQPDPVTAQLQLVLPDVAGLLDIDLGTPMSLVLSMQAGGYVHQVARFDGRIADLAIERVRVPHPDPEIAPRDGVLVTVQGVDYTADLAELDVGDTPWPQEAAQQRVLHILEAASGYEAVVPPNYGRVDTTGYLAARDVDRQPAKQLIVDTLAQQPNSDGNRVILAPYVDGASVAPGFDEIGGRHWPATAAALPAVLELDPDTGLVGVVMDAAGSTAWVLPASAIDGKVRWFRNKLVDVNQVDVRGTFDGSTEQSTVSVSTNRTPTVTRAVDVQLVESPAALRLAQALLPDVPVDTGWSLESLRYYGRHAVEQLLRGPFTPDHTGYGLTQAARTSCYQRPVVVDGIVPTQNPEGGTWVAGQLRSASIELRRGRYTIELQLRRTVPRPALTAPALTFAQLRAGAFAEVPPAGFDPTLRVYDTRLLRGDS